MIKRNKNGRSEKKKWIIEGSNKRKQERKHIYYFFIIPESLKEDVKKFINNKTHMWVTEGTEDLMLKFDHEFEW